MAHVHGRYGGTGGGGGEDCRFFGLERGAPGEERFALGVFRRGWIDQIHSLELVSAEGDRAARAENLEILRQFGVGQRRRFNYPARAVAEAHQSHAQCFDLDRAAPGFGHCDHLFGLTDKPE